jgi:hypothetical protein
MQMTRSIGRIGTAARILVGGLLLVIGVAYAASGRSVWWQLALGLIGFPAVLTLVQFRPRQVHQDQASRDWLPGDLDQLRRPRRPAAGLADTQRHARLPRRLHAPRCPPRLRRVREPGRLQLAVASRRPGGLPAAVSDRRPRDEAQPIAGGELTG